MSAFRIYYADGSAFGSEQGSWEEAPLDGVIMVVLQKGERTEHYSGADFYAKLDEDTLADTSDIAPLLRQHAKWIKHGVWTTHSNFEAIRTRAHQEFHP